MLTDGAGADASPRHWQASRTRATSTTGGARPRPTPPTSPPPTDPAGVDAPRLLHLDEREGAVLLWLEDVEGYDARDWELDELVAFAGALGRAQGRMAADGRMGPTLD